MAEFTVTPSEVSSKTANGKKRIFLSRQGNITSLPLIDRRADQRATNTSEHLSLSLFHWAPIDDEEMKCTWSLMERVQFVSASFLLLLVFNRRKDQSTNTLWFIQLIGEHIDDDWMLRLHRSHRKRNSLSFNANLSFLFSTIHLDKCL